MHSRFRYLFAALLVCALIWLAGLIWFISLIPFAPAQDTENTDAIVVLTGSAGRLERGFELLEEGRAKRLFISGVESGVTLPLLLRKKEYREFAGHIQGGSVTLGYQAHSTSGNAEESAEWIASQHIASIRLVTGNYHIPRSVFEFHAASPDITIIAEPVFHRPADHEQWGQWFEDMRLILLEYMKYVTTLARHRLAAS